MQVNIWKIIYLNFQERYEDMIDHHSYIHNLGSCEIKTFTCILYWVYPVALVRQFDTILSKPQPFANLVSIWVSDNLPFMYIEVDFAGPFYAKENINNTPGWQAQEYGHFKQRLLYPRWRRAPFLIFTNLFRF